MNPASSKSELRHRFLKRRSAVGAFAYYRWSWQICETILLLPEVQSAQTVMTYWPLVARREVDVRPLNRILAAQKRLVALPAVQRNEFGSPDALMDARQFADERQLVRGAWNLLEPVTGIIVAPKTIDVVVVPAVAIDGAGNRLGYGKGFYDRFLNQTQAFSIGVVFEACCADKLPIDPHDFRLHARVSERSVLRFDHLQPDHR